MNEKDRIAPIPGATSLQDAVERVMADLNSRTTLYCQFHRMPPNQGFPIHRHITTNEWTVVYDGEFELLVKDGLRETVAQTIDSLGKGTVIYIPAGKCHTIRPLKRTLRYGVVKDGPDDFHVC